MKGMKGLTGTALTCALLGGLLGAPALAAGPVDGEFDAFWWANDYDGTGVPSTDAGAPGYRASLWMKNKFGFKAQQFTSDLGDLGTSDAETLSVDVMWKAFAPTENNFLALGLGWEEMDMGGSGDTSGMRLSVQGSVSIMGQIKAYGEGAYLPSLDDNPTLGIQDADGVEYEVGVAWRAAPFVSVKAGYRATDVDFQTGGTAANSESTGFMLGLGVHF